MVYLSNNLKERINDLKELIEALRKSDRDGGTLWFAWQANIAMTIKLKSKPGTVEHKEELIKEALKSNPELKAIARALCRPFMRGIGEFSDYQRITMLDAVKINLKKKG